MLHPSYSDLMKVVNSEVEQGEAPVVNSRYSIVMATSKRARQIIGGDEPLVRGVGRKPLSVAIEELNEGKIKILSEEEAAHLQEQAEALESQKEEMISDLQGHQEDAESDGSIADVLEKTE